jgi:hypothetical protein
MRIFTTFGFAALLLAGCATAPSPEQMTAQRHSDEATCVSYGFKVGSDAYANCRMTLVKDRNASDLARRQAIGEAIADLGKPTPLPAPPQETECVSERQYDGKVVTKCGESQSSRLYRQASGQ